MYLAIFKPNILYIGYLSFPDNSTYSFQVRNFLAHMSWKLKWAFLITFCPLSVCLSVCLSVHPSVCKLFTFSSSSQEPLSQFQPNLAQNILGWRGFKFIHMKGPGPFLRGDNYKIVKIHWRHLKIFFSRTTEPISTKLNTKHYWVNGIQVCSNEGPRPFPRGDNYQIVKIHWQN